MPISSLSRRRVQDEPRGFASHKKKPKEVYQHANMENSSRCFIRLYKLYNSKCPMDRPASAFYLTPLAQPKGTLWYSKTPSATTYFGRIVSDMIEQASFEGHYTNHSLRVSLATRLFDAQVDEQLIMSRTGHSSTDSVRAYKRASSKLKQINHFWCAEWYQTWYPTCYKSCRRKGAWS